MKRTFLILAIAVITNSIYCQSSRRTTNSTSTTPTERSNSNREATKSSDRTSSSSSDRTSRATTGRTSQSTTNTNSGAVNSTNRNTTTRTNSERSVNSQPTHTTNNTSTTRTSTTRRSSANYHSSGSQHSHNGHNDSRHHTTTHYVYHQPANVNIVWTAEMHRHYVQMYPNHRWNYRIGYRIVSIPAYNAEYYIGDVRNVYGVVSEVYYEASTDEYFLGIGPNYPYQYFTIIVPGYLARTYSSNPYRYYLNRNIGVTGLITAFEGKPEILVKQNTQLYLY